MRELRQHADDIEMVIRLNAQYGSMVRTSLSLHGRLMRMQAERHKQHAIDRAANADARALHVAERSNRLAVLNPGGEPPKPACPNQAPIEAPAACVDQRTAENVSENGTNSHNTAFETRLNKQPRNQGSKGSDTTPPHEEGNRVNNQNYNAKGPERPSAARDSSSKYGSEEGEILSRHGGRRPP